LSVMYCFSYRGGTVMLSAAEIGLKWTVTVSSWCRYYVLF